MANEAVAYANKKGIDVIITDHHQKKQHPATSHQPPASSKQKPDFDLPKAHAIVWSDNVSGAGVAWIFAKEIYKHWHQNLLGFKASNALELSCIGTITDLMPSLGVNRSLIKHGLKELRQSKRPGIIALCSHAGIAQDQIGTYEIGYIIGPRINAMGRLEDALESLRLLCTKDKNRAEVLAEKLGLTNKSRQQLTETTFEHAKEKLKTKSASPVPERYGASWRKKSKIILVSHSSYNQGIIGLVAGRLVEEFYRPAIVISEDKVYSKGSVRSVNGFNIVEALRKLKDIFEDLGGHPMAAGFTIRTEKINEFKTKLKKLADREITREMLEPVIKADLELDLSAVSWELWEEIEKFSPFGLGNSKPVFVARNVKVINVRAVGRDQQHLKLTLTSHFSKPTLNFNAIAFNLGHLASKISAGDNIDICFNMEKNVWNGDESLELRIRDVKIKN
ncbi:hypothetical protein A3J78_01475 [Candidatus Beckwithbacteria bacterium RBG_13_35_6]|uniref:Single-stranded-DNA-specific exonuclease RecJ n=1 Tax=Candidatus Beckwithbacteria bacterium RBG_13_35_6 TaxID=1797456 RepID=A0A1F5DD47_9BACT|nr:MAG: hypothetical protein A3J78_01475 [Candidatus Beckwithbacteria bacterium RBG_13_35_6]